MHRKEELTLVFILDAIGVDAVLQRVQSVISSLEDICGGFKLFGRPVSDLAAVAHRLKEMNRSTFHLAGCNYEFDFGKVTNCGFDALTIKEIGLPGKSVNRISTWGEWVSPFLDIPGFVMGWIADSEYQHWQNAYDPLQFKSVGKDFSHLPMKSNGLPYPLEQSIIDTSNNPGRRVIQNGYYEVVGSVMWLGEPFWGLTGADRTAVEHADWIHKSSPRSSVIRLQVADEAFVEGTGRSGELQGKLRLLLFPNIG